MNGVLTPFAKFGLPAIAVALIGGGYAIHEHNAAENMATQNAQVTAQLSTTNAQLRALSTQVSSLNAANQAREAADAQRAAQMQRAGTAHRVVFDSRYKKLQSQVDEQGKAIDQARADLTSTQTDLAGAKTELGGSIAKTHDELVLLQKRGERNYAEFDIDKSKGFHRAGPLSIELRKANVKHQYADLNLMVDDAKLTQKHVNLYQPSMFYRPDSPQPVEIVINSITKNHIHGYISAPKYRQSELTAMADPNANQGDAQRVKLPTPSADDNSNQ